MGQKNTIFQNNFDLNKHHMNPREKNIMNLCFVDTPLDIKLELIKNVVNTMNINVHGLTYTCIKYNVS